MSEALYYSEILRVCGKQEDERKSSVQLLVYHVISLARQVYFTQFHSEALLTQSISSCTPSIRISLMACHSDCQRQRCAVSVTVDMLNLPE